MVWTNERMTEYERGQRDIQDWLDHNRKEDIPWKIKVCLENYPSNPRHQPYYDAMLSMLHQKLAGQETSK